MKEDMERKNQFVGNFTHELKTPMTSIIGYSDLIRSETLTREEEIKAANYIFSEAKRLERLSLKLLEIFVLNNEDITFIKMSPKSLIENIVGVLKNDYKNRRIKLSYSCEKGSCYMEPDLMRSLITNLIDNAGKAIEKEGEIKISCNMTENGCIIQVKDNGKGMPQYAINRITEAFYRVDKSRARKKGGAGLGLALCAKIVELHKGKINIDSKEGIGTIITIYIEGGR